MGSGDVSLLPVILDFMREVRDCFHVLAGHTHPQADVIDQGGTVRGHAGRAEELRKDLVGISR